jgi:LysM repeat protein
MISSKYFSKAGNILMALFLIAAGSLDLQAQTRKMTVYEYIEQYKSVAIEEMLRSKIPASITLAQGILESSNGNSALATEGNNHFGIKCKSNWTGRTIMEDDDEKQECFRAYETARDSYKDHSDYLMVTTRYAFLFDLGEKDYKGWAIGLSEAGYATNPNYPRLLIDLIEKHKLSEYDDAKLTSAQKTEEKTREEQAQSSQIKFNGIPAVVAKAGDSYAKIAIDNGIMVQKLYRYNDLEKDAIPVAGEKIYLKQKLKKGKAEFHTVQNSETMFSISQLHAVRLKNLLKFNLMEPGTYPAIGEKINLQKKREKPPALRNYLTENGTQVIEVRMGERKSKTKDSSFVSTGKLKTTAKTKTDPTDTETVKTNDPNTVVTAASPALPEYHTIGKGQTLYAIARQYNMDVKDLIAMNNLAGSEIKAGQKLIIAKKGSVSNSGSEGGTPDAASAPGDRPSTHIVQRGETLFSISRLYKMSVRELLLLNKIGEDAGIKAGQKLKVTSTGGGQEAGVVNTSVPDEVAPAVENADFHLVQKGETLYSISKKYGMSVKELTDINNISGEGIKAGQRLSVKKGATGNGSETSPSNNGGDPDNAKVKIHEVKSGDTMYSICKKYGISEKELMRLNNLSDNVIRIGQQLKVSE